MLEFNSSEKKIVKFLRNFFFVPNLHKKEVTMGHTHNEKQFLGTEVIKADHQLSAES